MDYKKEHKSLVAKIEKAHQFAQTDSTKSVLEDILPQLRESENERIRRTLVEYFGRYNPEDKWDDEFSFKDVLSYLEKQKEQKPALIPERIHPKFAVGDRVCRPMWSDHTIREIYVRCNDPVYVCVNEEGTESHIPFSEQDEWERKEQKSSITSKFNVGDKIYYKGDSYNRYVIKEVCEDYYINGFGQRMDMSYTDANFELLDHLDDVPLVAPQKPAWSEEDEKQLDDIISIIRGAYELGITISETRHRNAYSWLNNLFPQPKPEWSEEDILHYANVLEALEYVKGCKSDYDKIEAIKSDIAWLKSLPEKIRLSKK